MNRSEQKVGFCYTVDEACLLKKTLASRDFQFALSVTGSIRESTHDGSGFKQLVPIGWRYFAMRKCFSSMATVAVAFVMAVLASAQLFCQAQVVGSFENDLTSSVGVNWDGPGIPTATYTTVGATDGSTALAIHHSPSWNIQAFLKGGVPLAQDVVNHDFLVIDVTTTDLGVAGDGWSPAWRQLITVFNSSSGGWQQSDNNVPVASDDGGSLTSPVIVDLVATGIKTNAQAYLDAVNSGAMGTYWELFLPMQGGDQGTPIAAGDYSSNGVADAADYVAWRNSLGGSTLANETVSLGSVDAADYDEWRAHFGTDYSLITTIIDNVRFVNAGAGSGSLLAGGVPEPSSMMLAMVLGLALSVRRSSRSYTRVCG